MEKNRIYFNEKEHKYYDDRSIFYTSVTQLIAKFKESFDSEYWSKAKAIEEMFVNKYGWDNWNNAKKQAAGYKNLITILEPKCNLDSLRIIQERILTEWRITNRVACDRGNKEHNFLEEDVDNITGFVKNKETNEIYTVRELIEARYNEVTIEDIDKKSKIKERYPKIYKLLVDLVSNGFSLYSEIGVFSYDDLVSGKIDLLAIHLLQGKFYIVDWKTNMKELYFKSGYYLKMNGVETDNWIDTNESFLYPIQHIPLCKGMEYSLQLSLYSYLVELFGYACIGIWLCHIREDVDIIPIEYRKTDVKLMLNYYKSKL